MNAYRSPRVSVEVDAARHKRAACPNVAAPRPTADDTAIGKPAIGNSKLYR